MAPYAAASFAEDVATGNVAAKVSISSDGSHPNRIPAPAKTATARQQHHPRPVVGADRPESRDYPDRRGKIQHPASAAELGPDHAGHKPDDHRPGAEVPQEQVKHHHGQDNTHQSGTENMNHPAGA